ncbi:putative ATP-dependent RNA helicase dhx58 [Saguinus oedipus]|uniref:ATP-dependent RNA helicase dhx58 n=1 Tax=Saguinus oedipus TaxID=9490 RepID=A0ABQ9VN70_SAGOE|nr:putative ATP-dependent RNA helicase dhx58 [Saguinus oedipus]
MDQIHDHLEMPELSRDFGKQTYEQQVVKLSETGEDVGVGRGLATLGAESEWEVPMGPAEGDGQGLVQTLRPLHAAALAGLLEQRVYALHLRRYNDALLIHDTVRAVDALAALQNFYQREHATKTQILCAERWLLALFNGEGREGGSWAGRPGHR